MFRPNNVLALQVYEKENLYMCSTFLFFCAWFAKYNREVYTKLFLFSKILKECFLILLLF